jgi:predicted ester cyclase
VVARTLTEGTHTGPFMGHPPSGRRFQAAGIDVFRVAGGQLAEHWSVFDTLGMLMQLGLYRPLPPEGGR